MAITIAVHKGRTRSAVPPSCRPPPSASHGTKKSRTVTLRLSCSVFDDPLMIRLWNLHRLLRKEVIQPHLPVQLPCYGLTPVIRDRKSTCLNSRHVPISY